MAKLKNGQTLRKIHPVKLTVKPKVKTDWGHKRAALAAQELESEPYEAPRTLGKNGVVLKRRGFQIDDVTGRNAVAQFRRVDGTPSFFEVFGKDKPEQRSVGENILILRAYMHLNGLPPIDERETIPVFATIFARHVLPRRSWPLFGSSQKTHAEAFIAEWACKTLGATLDGRKAKEQLLLPGWALPDRAALYTPHSIAVEQRHSRERRG